MKLQIVDTEEFEEWLAVAEVISKTENRFSDILFEIRSRLGMIAKPWGHKDVVPVGPAASTWAFDDALTGVEVRRQVRQDIYKEFESRSAPVLANSYPAISKMLEESGVFPSLEEMREAMQRSQRRARAEGPPGTRWRTIRNSRVRCVRPRWRRARNIDRAATTYNPFRRAGRWYGRGVQGGARTAEPRPSRATHAGRTRRSKFAAPDAAPDQRYDPKDILQAISQIEKELGDAPVDRQPPEAAADGSAETKPRR